MQRHSEINREGVLLARVQDSHVLGKKRSKEKPSPKSSWKQRGQGNPMTPNPRPSAQRGAGRIKGGSHGLVVTVRTNLPHQACAQGRTTLGPPAYKGSPPI